MNNNYTSNEYFQSKPFKKLLSAFRRKYPNIDYHEIESLAAEAVLKTAKKYIPGKGVEFETFVYKKIDWLCLNYLEDNKRWTNLIVGPVDKTIQYNSPLWEKAATKEDIKLLELRFLYKYSLDEIAEILQVCSLTVAKKLKKLTKKLKKVYYN